MTHNKVSQPAREAGAQNQASPSPRSLPQLPTPTCSLQALLALAAPAELEWSLAQGRGWSRCYGPILGPSCAETSRQAVLVAKAPPKCVCHWRGDHSQLLLGPWALTSGTSGSKQPATGGPQVRPPGAAEAAGGSKFGFL